MTDSADFVIVLTRSSSMLLLNFDDPIRYRSTSAMRRRLLVTGVPAGLHRASRQSPRMPPKVTARSSGMLMRLDAADCAFAAG